MTVSGISSSSSSTAASSLTAAKTAISALLTSNGVLANLDSAGASKHPTRQQITSTLWTLLNTDGGDTLTKADVQKAVQTLLGGTGTSKADAIWSQISPYGLNKVTKTSFDKNSFLASSITSNMTGIQSAFATYTSSAAGIAEKSMTGVLTSNDVLQSLASQSSVHVPPTTNQVLSTLWALFDTSGAKTISQFDVQQAVLAEGGTDIGAKAIWSQLSPHGAPHINISQFVSSSFLTSVMTANSHTVQTDVAQIQLLSTGTSKSMLDQFSTSGGSVLNGAASGYNNSPIGSGRAYADYTNLFV